MKITIILFLLIISNAEAYINLLNYNTMCDICKGSSLPVYQQRLRHIKQQLKKFQPDLISFQEFRTIDHLENVLKVNPDYDYITYHKGYFGYPDAAIVYKKSRFNILSGGTKWLGPKDGEFSLGWKLAIPRVLVWAKIEDKRDKQQYMLISTHLDNRLENLMGSAKFIQEFIANNDLPVILAGDTNITFEMPEYQSISKGFVNAQQLTKALFYTDTTKKPSDLCYLKKGKVFPFCLVEHVLLSKQYNWEVEYMIIDNSRLKNTQFPSDHRGFLYRLSLKK